MHLSRTNKFWGTRFFLFDNLEHLTFFFSINRRICMAKEVERFFEVFFRTGTYMIWYIKNKLYQTQFRRWFNCRFLCRGWCTGRVLTASTCANFSFCKLWTLMPPSVMSTREAALKMISSDIHVFMILARTVINPSRLTWSPSNKLSFSSV